MYRQKFTFLILLLVITISLNSQSWEDLNFKMLAEVPVTPIKDQQKTSTCWSFATLSMIESELIAKGKGQFDLSEMWIVRFAYLEKAMKYVRMHGATNFSAGGATNDVIDMIAKYGIVPESAYQATDNGNKICHAEMDRELKAYVNKVLENKELVRSGKWVNEYIAMLDQYLGPTPERFKYQGDYYTPKSFLDSLNIKTENYQVFTSFIHHPFYSSFVLEVPDNWSWGEVQNVPLNELEQLIDSSLINGYSISWAADVSEPGFNWQDGIAYLSKKEDIAFLNNTTTLTNGGMSSGKESDNDKYDTDLSFLVEPEVNQINRQYEFDHYYTTDDHGMQIIGIAKDQFGNKYYKIKNSWGNDGGYNGYLYATRNYVLSKTTSLMFNIQALPDSILNKLEF